MLQSLPQMAPAVVPPLPIVPHFEPAASIDEQARLDQLVTEMIVEQPNLVADERLSAVCWQSEKIGPALHLDDFSAIRTPPDMATDYLQDRARLRARDGDFLVTADPPEDAFQDYFNQQLGLGSPTWLCPGLRESSLAVSCWANRSLRRRLVAAIRRVDRHDRGWAAGECS